MSRFTIRDLLLGTVIIGLALGWWLDRQRFGDRPGNVIQPAAVHYELRVTGKDNDKLYLYNPQTGAVWQRNGAGQWTPYADSVSDLIRPYPIPTPVGGH